VSIAETLLEALSMLRRYWLIWASVSLSPTAERTSAGLSDGRLSCLLELTFSVIACSEARSLARLVLVLL
jgi:hypothetical protein